MKYPIFGGSPLESVEIEDIEDVGSDGKIPIRVSVQPGADSSTTRSVYGVMELSHDTDVTKGGVRRLLIRTRLPVPNVETTQGCCDQEVTEVNPEMVTCHTVVTLPTKVAKALLGTDESAVAVANASVNTVIAAHLHHIAKAMGYLGAALLKTDLVQPSEDPVYVAGVVGASFSARSGDILGDAGLIFSDARLKGNLRRMFAGTGADLASVTSIESL